MERPMHKTRLIITIFLLGIIPGIFAPSCKTNRGQLIPYVEFDIYLLLYADLADLGIGNTKVIDGGVNGIVIYRESEMEFHAYDRTCTMWPEHDAAVVEDSTFFGVYECPVCGSTYLLMNGGEPNSGPAQYPLVEYHTSLSHDVLHVYN
jgi:Rieske Fe-S protein